MARKRSNTAEETSATVPAASSAAALAIPGRVSGEAPLAGSLTAPHPALIALVRLLARQAVQAEIAAQLPED